MVVMNVKNTSYTIYSNKQSDYYDKQPIKDQSANKSEKKLTDKEKAQVEKLKKEDLRIRAHENAHKAAAGSHSAGGPNYKYKIGPDGKKYAIGGDVRIDISEVSNDPEATIRKARQIKSAALAPNDPSQQDLKVAIEAERMEVRARQEVIESRKKKNENYSRSKKIVSPYQLTNNHSKTLMIA